jgi:hypothetical protein
MVKAKHLIFISVFLGMLCLIVFFTKLTKAQETTFPVEEAGIAAYVKLDSDPEKMIQVLTDALNYYSEKEVPRTASNYVIGVVEVENGMLRWVPHYNYPHLYIGLDGWMVAYYLKDEEASQIMQWKDYTPGEITTTTLKDAIDLMCDSIEVAYSGDIKYYDFKFPDANKMTLIAETVSVGGSNSFSLTIPGTLYEVSYSVYYGGQYYNWYAKLIVVDGTEVFSDGCVECDDVRLKYGYYEPLTLLETNIPHLITIKAGPDRAGAFINAATVLIYQN